MTEKQAKAKQETDWKAIAMALAKRVNFAMHNCTCQGGMMDMKTGKVTGWLDYMAESLDMIPGVAVDREILATMYLPKAKGRKAREEIMKRRAETAPA
ncbi:hypothetical protein [Delftia tsuruhatensis]|uniref:hypothetical protein n=1 Tax=Delftia tsuruhatensis TaxID=180282 RepID=UPI003A8B6C75